MQYTAKPNQNQTKTHRRHPVVIQNHLLEAHVSKCLFHRLSHPPRVVETRIDVPVLSVDPPQFFGDRIHLVAAPRLFGCHAACQVPAVHFRENLPLDALDGLVDRELRVLQEFAGIVVRGHVAQDVGIGNPQQQDLWGVAVIHDSK